MIQEILSLIFMTFLPVFELRLSIPAGLFTMNLSWETVFLVTVVSNIIAGVIVFYALHYLINFLLKFDVIKKPYNYLANRARKKAEKKIEKYGWLALTLFIAIPLPGSGVWTGALIAHLFDIKFKKFLIADILGVLIAGTIVTAVSLGVVSFL
ncbi:MAG: small multi-drug export protein [archaeon]